MTDIHLKEFFGNYLKEICVLLNPLIDYSDSFIKFRSDIVAKQLSDEFSEMPDEMTELHFSIIPNDLNNYSFQNIEKIVSSILLSNTNMKEELVEFNIVIDLFYKTIPEYFFPALVVKIYFIGKQVDFSIINGMNSNISHLNKSASITTGFWTRRRTSKLETLLKDRNTTPFDFYKHKGYFLLNNLGYVEMFNKTLLNYYVPHSFSMIDLQLDDKISLFDDIQILDKDSRIGFLEKLKQSQGTDIEDEENQENEVPF